MKPAPPECRFPICAALLAGVLAAAGPAHAQREGYTYLSWVGSEVSLVSPADEDTSARPNMPVIPGDVLVTGDASRAEAILADGTVVRLDGRSELRFEWLNRTYEADDDRTILALARGTIAVEVREVSTRERALRLDTDDATILSPARSLFRVDAGRRGTEIYVLAGKVDVNGRGGRAPVRAGEYAFVSGDADIEVEPAGAPHDPFARFVEERRGTEDRRDEARAVASDYSYDSAAASFEDFGSWTTVSSVGAICWRPNVPADWTPYSLGTWRWTPAGLTWVSYETWGWLPYHYGTWGWDPSLGWYWVPGSVYAPAWVYWSSSPEWTGWCPIGWYGHFGPASRSTRLSTGNERGGPWLPHPRGRVDVTQIDRRGWNFAPTPRVGSRLDPRDVTRGDRVPFPRGQSVVVAAGPPRPERGANRAPSGQEAMRRIGLSEAPRRAGQDGSWREAPGRAAVARGPESAVRPARGPRADEGWRSTSSPAPATVERRGGDRRERQGDTGWRAPAPRVIERSSERPAFRREASPRIHEAPAREVPVRHESVHPAPAPPPRPAAPPPQAPPSRRDR